MLNIRPNSLSTYPKTVRTIKKEILFYWNNMINLRLLFHQTMLVRISSFVLQINTSLQNQENSTLTIYFILKEKDEILFASDIQRRKITDSPPIPHDLEQLIVPPAVIG